MTQQQFTPTQQRIMDVLRDGEPHRREELWACLEDPLASIQNIRPHLTAMRKVLRPRGEDVLCVWVNRRFCYRWVRILSGRACNPLSPPEPS